MNRRSFYPAQAVVFGTIATVLAFGTGCIRVGMTQMRVRDPSAVGVVANKDDRWLLPPHGPPGVVIVYENFAIKDSVERAAPGSIVYVSHAKLFTPATVMPETGATSLVTTQGSIWPWTMPGSFGPLGGAGPLVESVRRGDPLRLPIYELGACGVDSLNHCYDSQAAVSMSLAIDSTNVQEIRTVRAPLRFFGFAEVPMGILAGGFGVVNGVLNLQDHPTASRNTMLGVDAGLIVLGGALIANGLWYLLAKEEQSVLYRAPD